MRLFTVTATLISLVFLVSIDCGNAAENRHDAPRGLSAYQAVALGLVEGATEYLPVSSTGHLLLTQRLMGIGESGPGGEAAEAYAICIQLGAILAVFWLYFGRIRSIALGLLGRDDDGRKTAINLALSFLPAAVIGVAFEKHIKSYLFGLWPISIAWAAGGIALVALALRKSDITRGRSFADLAWRQAVIIGMFQCLAMWPGTSRSLITIIGGVLVGLSLSAAVEYSFLLGLVTLSAATGFEGLQQGGQIIAAFGWLNSSIGVATAFLAAIVSVKLMVSFLNKNSMLWFGAYRILLSIAVSWALLAGRL